MTKKITLSTLFLVFIYFLSNSITPSHSFSSEPPPFNAGAPGMSNCSSAGCHPDNINGGSGSVNISLGDNATEYSIGENFPITVSIQDNDAVRFGFQMVALDDDGNSVGEFTSGTNSNVQSSGGIDFVNHKNIPNPNPSTYELSWSAPLSTDVGNITFYAVGNAANGVSGPAGDQLYSTSTSISPAITEVGIENNTSLKSFEVYPNPITQDFLTINLQTNQAAPLKISLIDIMGREVAVFQSDIIVVNSMRDSFDVSNIPNGVFFVKVETENTAEVKKVIFQ